MFYRKADWSSMDRLTAQLPLLGMALVRHEASDPVHGHAPLHAELAAVASSASAGLPG